MPGPSAAAPVVASAPARGSRPVTAQAAAAPAHGPYEASSQEPTLIGDVTLNTRIMLRKRSGRPRSRTSATADSPIAPAAAVFAARDSSWLPVSWANPASTDDAPARPPRNRYPGTSGDCHTGALMTGRP
jgi:hypothetical protein